MKSRFPRVVEPSRDVYKRQVLGLYNDYENRVEIRLYRGASAVVTIPVPNVFNGKMCIRDREYLKRKERGNFSSTP